MAETSTPGVMFCDATISIYPAGTAATPTGTADDTFLAEITDISGFGATRNSVRSVHAGLTENWAQTLYSCFSTMKPIRITGVFSPTKDWVAQFDTNNKPTPVVINMPNEAGETTVGKLAFLGKVTDFEVQGPIEDRSMFTCVITPSGKPVLTQPVT